MSGKKRTWPPDPPEPWQSLKVGDRIRIVRLPSEIEKPGYVFPECTRRLYELLIKRGRPLRISEIDEWSIPWIWCRTKDEDGSWTHHALAVNDDSWVRVKPRLKRTSSRK